MYHDAAVTNEHLGPAAMPGPRSAGPKVAAWPGFERRGPGSAAPSWLSMVLDEIDYGVLLVDRRRRVLHANRAALAQLEDVGTLLLLERDELTAAHPRDVAALNAAIRDAVAKQLRRMVMIGRPAQRMGIAVVPLACAEGEAECRVLILLARPQICEALSAHGYARDHGLSGAESQVLDALCQGMEPAAIAAIQGIAMSTVRSHISNIRIKTEATSIRELVQRVALLPPIRNALRGDVRHAERPLRQ